MIAINLQSRAIAEPWQELNYTLQCIHVSQIFELKAPDNGRTSHWHFQFMAKQ
jgi:hypothetical protein